MEYKAFKQIQTLYKQEQNNNRLVYRIIKEEKQINLSQLTYTYKSIKQLTNKEKMLFNKCKDNAVNQFCIKENSELVKVDYDKNEFTFYSKRDNKQYTEAITVYDNNLTSEYNDFNNKINDEILESVKTIIKAKYIKSYEVKKTYNGRLKNGSYGTKLEGYTTYYTAIK